MEDKGCVESQKKLNEKPASGAPATGAPKGKGKEKVKEKVHRILGDCIHWMTKGQCAKRDSCSFKYDPDKKKQGERPWSTIFADTNSQK